MATAPTPERSQSRGREAFSTGRGGLGNIRQGSASRTRPEGGPDDFSVSRGREPAPASNGTPTKVYSTGRGGAGNIRSPSRDPGSPTAALPVPIEESEKEIIRNHMVASQDVPQSTGRGGLGNITGSRSRSRGPALATSNAPMVHSTGRGGAGNIATGETGTAEALDESERKIRASTTEAPYHSTGRGGIANLASGPQPAVEQVVRPPAAYGSTGRGGAGNIKHNN